MTSDASHTKIKQRMFIVKIPSDSLLAGCQCTGIKQTESRKNRGREYWMLTIGIL